MAIVPAGERIIVALDVKGRAEAMALVRELADAFIFKVGLELFTAEGPELVRELREAGKDVFLDLKLHDIPNTVASAVRSGARLGVRMMTLHAAGGLEMMRAAVEAATEGGTKGSAARPLLLAVTVLTSLKEEDLERIGMEKNMDGQVLRLARLAREAGADGVVSSPREIELLRKNMDKDFLIVTPGIRPAWAADSQDQKRVLSPGEAIARGADYIVIGRPITRAPSPAEAFRKVVSEIAPFLAPG